MFSITKNNQLKFVKNAIASVLLISATALVQKQANAYDLQANTIYANSAAGIFKIDIDAGSATKVADSNASLSSMQDIAFDGSTLYGINMHWQLLKLEPSENETVAVNQASSFSLQFQGLESRNGVLYGAELRSLLIIDKKTAAPSSPGPGAFSYGLGAGEVMTDLAYAEDGTLYASVKFPGLSFNYLGTLDPSTGSLMVIGNTGVEAVVALTVKDGVIYAMDKPGTLYTLNEVSGFATEIAKDVLPGVNGMDTSPMNVSVSTGGATGGGGDAGGTGESGGSLSVFGLLSMLLITVIRRLK